MFIHLVTLAFGRTVDLAEWELHIRKVKPYEWIVPAGWTPKPVGSLEFPEELLPVIRKRRDNATLIHADDLWQPEDTIIFLTRLPLSKVKIELG